MIITEHSARWVTSSSRQLTVCLTTPAQSQCKSGSKEPRRFANEGSHLRRAIAMTPFDKARELHDEMSSLVTGLRRNFDALEGESGLRTDAITELQSLIAELETEIRGLTADSARAVEDD